MIFMPLSQKDFDPSEASIPWKVLLDKGIKVVFATPTGQPASGDIRMLTGQGLGPWKPFLRARKDAIDAYNEMVASPEFQKPLKYQDVNPDDFQGIMLHGGHAPGIKDYLESTALQEIIGKFIEQNKPVAAICHGVLLLARTQKDGKSVIHGKKVTCLLQSLELTAYNLTRLWLGKYYITYPGTTTQKEVTSFLASPSDFCTGPSAFLRDSMENLSRGFTVRDGNILTARWPGDAYSYSLEFIKMLPSNYNANATA